MQHFHSTSAMEGNFEVKLHEFLNTENEQHVNNLLMAFAPCQQLCWRKWSWWSPPGHREVQDRQRDHRTPFCGATAGAGWCGGSKHQSHTVPRLVGLGGDPFPPPQAGTLHFMHNKGRKGHQGWRARMAAQLPSRPCSSTGHTDTGGSSSSHTHSPPHISWHKLIPFPPSPPHPSAIPPHSTPVQPAAAPTPGQLFVLSGSEKLLLPSLKHQFHSTNLILQRT